MKNETAPELKTKKYQIRFVIVTLICLFAFNLATATQKKAADKKIPTRREKTEVKVYPVPPPLVYQGLFPCQACHQRDIRGVSSQLEKSKSFLGKYLRAPDPTPRILVRMHRDISLKHAEWHWCLNCHSTYERNYLKLMTGENISFEQSYRLCGQCHGTIYRDWKIGIHGRRVGQWNGKKLYLLCAHCHDPHKPRFRKLPGKEPPHFLKSERWKWLDHHQ
jgi:hypothetical protein